MATTEIGGVKDYLLKRIFNREIVAGVVGLGYVGLPLAVEIAKSGFKTVGFDIDTVKTDSVNHGCSYIREVGDADLRTLVDKGVLIATTDFSKIVDVDFVAVCVPTPLDSYRQPDMSHVKAAIKSVAGIFAEE